MADGTPWTSFEKAPLVITDSDRRRSCRSGLGEFLQHLGAVVGCFSRWP